MIVSLGPVVIAIGDVSRGVLRSLSLSNGDLSGAGGALNSMALTDVILSLIG